MKNAERARPLRQAAEARLRERQAQGAAELGDEELRRALHELQVHEIELQMQNEELQQSRAALEESHARYRALYDFAPVGYLTLDRSGKILAANVTLATLLGTDPGRVVGRQFAGFVNRADQGAFQTFIAQAFGSGAAVDCDLALVDHCELYVHLRSEKRDLDDGLSAAADAEVRVAVLDVTDRRRAEQQLQAAERMARATLDSLPAQICVVDSFGDIVAVNRRWREFAQENGAAAGLVGGVGNYLAVCDAVTEADGEAAAQARQTGAGIRALIDGDRETFSLEYPCDCTAGARWFVAQGRAFPAPDGKRVVISHFDITERKQAEIALRASEARFRCVVESAMDAVICADERRRVVIFNEAAEHMFGYSASEILGQPMDKLLPQRFQASHTKSMSDFAAPALSNRLVGGERRMGGERRVVGQHADGHEFPIDVSIAFLSMDGTYLHTAMVRDLTSRVRSAEALSDAHRFSQQILTSIGEGLVVFDRTLSILVWNRAIEGMTGIAAEAACGKTLSETLREFGAATAPYLQRALAGESVVAIDMISVGRVDDARPVSPIAHAEDGNSAHRWLLPTFAPLRDAAGRIEGVVMSVLNVTALKRSQNDLLDTTQRLRRLGTHIEHAREDERKRVARELHDELGSVLTGLTMHLRTTLAETGDGQPTIAGQLNDALELVAQAKQSTHRIMNDLRPHILDNLGVWAAIQRLAEQFESRAGIACKVSVDAHLSETAIAADHATMLFRVTQEALTNVAKHAHASRVRVQAKLIHSVLKLDIWDNGQGADRARLLNAETHGMLGMEERVREFGGHLVVETTPDKGTRVRVSLPME